MERDIYYKISKEKLMELFTAYAKLSALEWGGVDSWEWYDFCLSDFLRDYGLNSFEEYAKKEIENYSFVSVCHIAECEIEANYEDFIKFT